MGPYITIRNQLDTIFELKCFLRDFTIIHSQSKMPMGHHGQNKGSDFLQFYSKPILIKFITKLT